MEMKGLKVRVCICLMELMGRVCIRLLAMKGLKVRVCICLMELMGLKGHVCI